VFSLSVLLFLFLSCLLVPSKAARRVRRGEGKRRKKTEGRKCEMSPSNERKGNGGRRGKLATLYLARLDRLNKVNDLESNNRKYS
jgi:hypothetical protein